MHVRVARWMMRGVPTAVMRPMRYGKSGASKMPFQFLLSRRSMRLETQLRGASGSEPAAPELRCAPPHAQQVPDPVHALTPRRLLRAGPLQLGHLRPQRLRLCVARVHAAAVRHPGRHAHAVVAASARHPAAPLRLRVSLRPVRGRWAAPVAVIGLRAIKTRAQTKQNGHPTDAALALRARPPGGRFGTARGALPSSSRFSPCAAAMEDVVQKVGAQGRAPRSARAGGVVMAA